ncbi:MAG TPA: M20/M25/M40 family metallo-hydrolase [Pyrinomonadaceae bacterium]|nr:M20/M25/M40 family metallo-hydrolase [Pyrinomonadaceae bacterium]
MRRNFVTFLLSFTLLASIGLGQAVRITPVERKIAAGITADQMSNYLYFVASDAMEGRDTPSRGLDTTAEFLKMNLSRWGFKPAGDNGTFFQKIELASESVDPANNLLQIDGKTFNLGADFYRLAGNGSANALMVFAGNGWQIKSKNLDPYKGVDVRGKILVLSGEGFPNASTPVRLPSGISRSDLTGTKGVDWSDPVTYATANGAVGIIVIASSQTQTAWPRLGQFFSRGSMYPAKLREAPPKLPVILVSDSVAKSIFAGAPAGKESTTAFTIDKTVSMTAMSRSESKWTQNVVALWEGRDPTLKNEMVAVGAHYDHVGTNPNAPGDDKIWNGADDDGSGTVAVLAIAEALAKSKLRPKRSILFVWHCGEEKGLWGSEYFNKFPTVDIKNVVAQLNIDMIGRSKKAGDANPKNKDLTGENAIYVIGSEMMSSTLGSIVKGANEGFLKLDYDYRYDDPKDTNRFFFRSDHFNYALNGIPITFWFDGVHEDYHGPGDSPDKIDYEKMEKVARTIFLTMWEVSDLATRPKIDKQLPPELSTAR